MAKKAKRRYAVYPSTPNIRTGCKVSWNYYDRLVDAQRCAEAAKINAVRQMELGYDFGYCSPGSIRKIPDDAKSDREDVGFEYAGKYEVCIP